jgi:hypothetical protein
MLGRIRTAGFLNSAGVTATNNYLSAGSAQLNRRTYDVKINYVKNDKTTIFGRYSRSNGLLFDPTTGNVLIGGNGSTPLDDGVDVGLGQFLPRVGVAYKWGAKA